jgi:hypothetical protein
MKPRIDNAAIYASRARAARPAALPAVRHKFCETACYQAAANGYEVCGEKDACKNLVSDAAARRPRTIEDLISNFYGEGA